MPSTTWRGMEAARGQTLQGYQALSEAMMVPPPQYLNHLPTVLRMADRVEGEVSLEILVESTTPAARA